jgi:hypothetical protein
MTHIPRPDVNHDDTQHDSRDAQSVLAAAGAAVALAHAEVAHERSCEADAAAEAAIARLGDDLLDEGPEDRRAAHVAHEHAVVLAAEHNRLAKQSVVAATRAVESLVHGVPVDDFAASAEISDGIAAVVAAKTIVRDSNASLLAHHQSNDS